MRALFEWDVLLELVSRILGRAPLHRYADPLGAMNLAVMREGDTLGWHFDQTDFVVSLAIQPSDGGGEFENVQRLRWVEGGGIEERYDTVARVLAGEVPELVTTVPMTPGTLMLFEGRWSLHRVTPVVGTTPRHVALFGYDTKPGTMSSELLKQIRYGRSEPEPAAGVMQLGESFVGTGGEAAHVNTVLGEREGPVGAGLGHGPRHAVRRSRPVRGGDAAGAAGRAVHAVRQQGADRGRRPRPHHLGAGAGRRGGWAWPTRWPRARSTRRRPATWC